jgi:adenosylcobinamide-phosphate synthase
VLAAACAPIVGGSPAAALRTARAFGAHHPSPNAGQCEAAFAGALGVRLGGTNMYHGVAEHRPRLGDGRSPDAADIRRAVRLSRAVTVVAVITAALTAIASAAVDRPRRHHRRTGTGTGTAAATRAGRAGLTG